MQFIRQKPSCARLCLFQKRSYKYSSNLLDKSQMITGQNMKVNIRTIKDRHDDLKKITSFERSS